MKGGEGGGGRNYQDLARNSFNSKEEREQGEGGGGANQQENITSSYTPLDSQEEVKELLDGESLSKTEISFLQAEKELLQKKLEIHLNMWELDKRLLEQNHIEVMRSHKVSVARSAYETAKLSVSLGLQKHHELLTRVHLEEPVNDLRNTVKVLKDRLQITTTQHDISMRNKKSTFEKLISVNQVLQGCLQATKEELLDAKSKIAEKEGLELELSTSRHAQKMLTAEKDALISQLELAIQEVQDIKNKMVDSKGLVEELRDSRLALEKVTEERNSLQMQLENADSKRFEKLSTENKTLHRNLEMATRELLELKQRMVDGEKLVAEVSTISIALGRLTEEKCTLHSQLQLAECKLAKAFKLVQEKEDELEDYTVQLEDLRQRNDIMKVQLNMEQLCRESDVVDTAVITVEARELVSRNPKEPLELVASSPNDASQGISHNPSVIDATGSKARKGCQSINTTKPIDDSPLEDDSEHLTFGVTRERTVEAKNDENKVPGNKKRGNQPVQTYFRRQKPTQKRPSFCPPSTSDTRNTKIKRRLLTNGRFDDTRGELGPAQLLTASNNHTLNLFSGSANTSQLKLRESTTPGNAVRVHRSGDYECTWTQSSSVNSVTCMVDTKATNFPVLFGGGGSNSADIKMGEH